MPDWYPHAFYKGINRRRRRKNALITIRETKRLGINQRKINRKKEIIKETNVNEVGKEKIQKKTSLNTGEHEGIFLRPCYDPACGTHLTRTTLMNQSGRLPHHTKPKNDTRILTAVNSTATTLRIPLCNTLYWSTKPTSCTTDWTHLTLFNVYLSRNDSSYHTHRMHRIRKSQSCLGP